MAQINRDRYAQLTDQEKRIIKEAAGLGLRQDDIAHLLELSPATFKSWITKHEEIKELIQQGKAIATRKVARKLMDMIESGGKESVPAIFFYLKCQAGWRETDRQEIDTSNIKIYLPEKNTVENEKK